MKPIGYIRTPFPTKFGVPRQSGLVTLASKVVLEAEYSDPECVRGLDEYSHIWLIWGFSDVPEGKWSPTVRPPRLGGNRRMGVFATRSPYRPNAMGLSCVKLVSIGREDGRTVLTVEGIDTKDATPVYDIKPYLPYTDSHPDAKGGFAAEVLDYALEVTVPEAEAAKLDGGLLEPLTEILSQDPRPSYQDDPDRVYGFEFDRYEVKFKVDGKVLTVTQITKQG